MVGSTDVSVPPLGNAPFLLKMRHLCAELRLSGQAIAGRQKVLTSNAHTKWAAGGPCGGLREFKASDRLQTEPPRETPVTGGAALLASAPQMSGCGVPIRRPQQGR